jgi:hypothetical protein
VHGCCTRSARLISRNCLPRRVICSTGSSSMCYRVWESKIDIRFRIVESAEGSSLVSVVRILSTMTDIKPDLEPLPKFIEGGCCCGSLRYRIDFPEDHDFAGRVGTSLIRWHFSGIFSQYTYLLHYHSAISVSVPCAASAPDHCSS